MWSGLDMPQNEATSRLRRYDAIQGARTAKKQVDKQLIRENDIIDLQSISTIDYYIKTHFMSKGATIQGRTHRFFKLESIDLYAYILSFLVPKGKLNGETVDIFTLMNIKKKDNPKKTAQAGSSKKRRARANVSGPSQKRRNK